MFNIGILRLMKGNARADTKSGKIFGLKFKQVARLKKIYL